MEKSLKEILIKQAKAKGMCLPNYEPLNRVDDMDFLIGRYITNIDWALENKFPTYDILRHYLSDCQQYGLYVDVTFDGETLCDKQVYVFHNCRGIINVEMNVEAQIIPMLYFANGCDMKVVCEQANPTPIRIPLYIFDKNKIKAKDCKGATFVKYITYTI